LVGFASKLHGKVRYMALGDYANSRGAADMGVLPDRGPGYAKTAKSGLTAPHMIEAAQNGKLKALYVVGANPLAHFGTLGYGRGKTELLIVHELFMTENRKQADIIFPAASAYEKRRPVTNTSGEVQLPPQSCRGHGPTLRFRSASHSVASTRKAGSWQGVPLQERGDRLRRNPQDCSGVRSGAYAC